MRIQRRQGQRARPMRLRAQSCSPFLIRVHVRDNDDVFGKPTGLTKLDAGFTICAGGHWDSLDLKYASLYAAETIMIGNDSRSRNHAMPWQGRRCLSEELDDYKNTLVPRYFSITKDDAYPR